MSLDLVGREKGKADFAAGSWAGEIAPRGRRARRGESYRGTDRRLRHASAVAHAPQQLRHAHAIEMAQEGVPLNIIQRQLGHTDLGVTSTYLQGIDNAEIVNAVHARGAPMMPASAGLRL